MSEYVEFDMDKRPEKTGGAPGAAGTYQAYNQPKPPAMAAWLIKKGIIKDEAGAKKILLAVIFFDFLIALAVIYFFVLR